MTTADILENIRQRALYDKSFRKSLLDSRAAEEPVSVFCRICRENGYMIYDMDIIALGEEEYAAMKRSTNGGGENSPVLEGQDDYYELFMMELERYGLFEWEGSGSGMECGVVKVGLDVWREGL